VSASEAGWITVARLGRTRGNRGEITAVGFTSKPERFQHLREVHLFGSGERREVEGTWFHDGTLIFKFRGVDSIGEAEKLTGAEVRIPVSERVRLEAGEFFLEDLKGCDVVERRTGELLGKVTDVDDSGRTVLLVVGEGLLIPFARSICVEIDPVTRRIAVELPEGLKGLNSA
jgi:16S rRNA processing protein RimM